MYTLFQQPDAAVQLQAQCREMVAELTSKIPASRQSVTLGAQQDLFPDSAPSRLLVLREGSLSYALDDRVLFFFEEGDLVGLEHCCGVEPGAVRTEYAVVVDEYDADAFMEAVRADAELLKVYSRYIISQTKMFAHISAQISARQTSATPDVRHFKQGEQIIAQGATDTDVYTLLDGHAEVFVHDVKVGEVEADEIFGAIAALMETPRSATVVATCPCSVLVLPKDGFAELIQERPEAVLQMVNALANKIIALNQQVVGLHGAE